MPHFPFALNFPALNLPHLHPQADFMKWVRAGGAISKRSVTSREADALPPHQLINDMCDLDEGTRQLAMVFQQTRAIQVPPPPT